MPKHRGAFPCPVHRFPVSGSPLKNHLVWPATGRSVVPPPVSNGSSSRKAVTRQPNKEFTKRQLYAMLN